MVFYVICTVRDFVQLSLHLAQVMDGFKNSRNSMNPMYAVLLDMSFKNIAHRQSAFLQTCCAAVLLKTNKEWTASSSKILWKARNYFWKWDGLMPLQSFTRSHKSFYFRSSQNINHINPIDIKFFAHRFICLAGDVVSI